MNAKYLFIINNKSSNLINPFKGEMFINGYLTEYIAVEDTGYQILLESGETRTCYVMLFDANKTQITTLNVQTGVFQPYRTLYSATRYVRILIPNPITPNECYFGTGEDFDSWWNNEVHPLWNDSLSVDYEKEGQEQFFRKKLSGQLTFVGTDYAYIKSKDINYTFSFVIYMSNDNGQTWQEYWKGHFCWTDCEFNEDDNNIKVTPVIDDEYINVLAGLEKEYNLIDLAPAVYEIELKKRPVIQIIPIKTDNSYSKAGCFKVDGTYWERDCNQVTFSGPTPSIMSRDYKFNLASGIVELNITPQGRVPQGFATYIKDMFTGHIYSTSQGYREYSLRYSRQDISGRWRFEIRYENPEIIITNLATNVVTWQGYITVGVAVSIPSKVSNYDALTITMDNPVLLFSRLVFDKAGVSGAVPIPGNDIMANNENYHYCLQEYDVNRYLYYTDEYSTTPTKWGKHDSSHYWIEPQESGVEGWSPIAFSTWDDIALWFGYTADLFPTEGATMADALLRNAYRIEDCISVLLQKVAPDITLAASNFLSGTDPITNDTRTFFLTPKTNVKKINYDMPAMNAPITLKAIFDMLRDGYRAYWYIENNELHIEHLLWFLNGGKYTDPTDADIQIDLTQSIVSRNGKNWAFGLNKYTYDKPEMTERYEFGWMDNVTLPFKGEPLNIIANFVEKGKVDKIDITQFSSDIDYILMNPEDISDDGFVLMGAVYDNNAWSLAFKEFTDMDFVKLQNAYCAFVYMQTYYLYDLPSLWYRIGEREQQYARKVMKSKTQEVSFPCQTDPDMQKLIKSAIGVGQLEKISINLSSRNGKATLKFEV